MVIGYDGSRAFSADKTGTENYSYQLLSNLAKIDHKNDYLVYLRPQTQISIKSTDWPNNFHFKTIPFTKLWTQVGLSMQTFNDSLDVLFVPAHTVPLIHRPRLKTVMTVHDLGAEYLPQLHQLKQRLYLTWISRVQMRSCTKLIAVSHATKADLQKRLGIKEQIIDVIYEGVNDDLIKNDIEVDVLNDIDIENGKYFLFVGTIQPRKNLERLITAFAHLVTKHPELEAYKLVLAGGKGWSSDRIYELPKKLSQSDRIIFTGRVTDKQVTALYKNAFCFVYPSLFEGFGLPILEAFQFGLPVITSNVSSMPEVAGKGALMVDPYDVDALYSSMHTLVKSADLRKKLIKEGQLQLAKFSWEKCAKETLKLLEEVGNGK